MSDEPTAAPRPIVALMQPSFLPWVGYFALMDSVDEFILLDDFQFVRQSFQQRNRLFQPGEARVDWVTVPVVHPGSEARQRLVDVQLADFPRFRKRFSTTLQQSYARCAGAKRGLQVVEAALATPPKHLAELNGMLIKAVASALGITTPIRLSSELPSEGRRSERVASLLRNAGARSYYAARGAAAYMREDGVFPLADIATYFQHYVPQPYPQRHVTTFTPYLSALDVLMQTGEPSEALAFIRAGALPFDPFSRVAATVEQAAEEPTES